MFPLNANLAGSVSLIQANDVQYYVIMCNILKTRRLTHSLRSQTDFMRDCVNTRRYRLNSLSYFAPKVWDMIPLEIKNINSLQKFKTEIRK